VIFVLQAAMIIVCWVAIRGVTLEGLQSDAAGLSRAGGGELQAEPR